MARAFASTPPLCSAPSCSSRPASRPFAAGRWPLACTATAGKVTAGTVLPEALALQAQLLKELDGINRGIFGVRAEQQSTIHALVEQLEALNRLADPAQHLEELAGSWILRYSTIKITGTKRSKLGLREFVKIGDMHQSIDVETSTAVSSVDFSVTGFGLMRGQLRITAKFEPVSGTRVDVKLVESHLQPEQLQRLFQKNYDLLLSIFNPEGWLEITYVDASFRVGRDNHGNLFVLERHTPEPLS